MARDPAPLPRSKGLTAEAPSAQPSRLIEGVATGMSLVWVIAVLSYIFTSPPGDDVKTLGLVMTLLIVFLPLALIWVAVITLRSVRDLRAEAARLQASVDAMRSSYVQASGQMQPQGVSPEVEKKLEEIAAATRQAESVLATFSSRRDTALSVPSADRKAAMAPPRPEPEAEEPRLALGTPPEDMRAPLDLGDFVRALNFPESPDDKEGFRALRMALEDRSVAKLIRSAQDVLTLLSQEGIYMDDLKPEMAHPDVWRRFAAGERGRSVATLGGIRDRSSLALTSARMREDTIFRDAAHHFLRTFDRNFTAFEQNASDAELVDLADTRTARAFMLIGRVAGVFD
ncbi:hypothetical protein Q9295_07975 [Xinfangfangia sp. CPCC 101601]|uniref:Uncharacterized protein n=1 Tax=Pseudogemmobacter lacusdianii TaxID=3069608 RepID=A0ABU0VX08_9RHOB|nr:hypothetical protein [Xinfangfangia sp. CPCC 101601]MDQ2066306.1 hypothetical protein [Xinfangfangia sp. CPCC 101601]